MRISKTVTVPIGGAIPGNAAGSEVALETCGLSVGTFVSVSHGSCCELDRVETVGPGTITLKGKYRGAVRVQALADLSGCWLSLETAPEPPISIGIVCCTPEGILLDRSFPECALGRTLEVNGQSLGSILGAAVMPDGRSVISVTSPKKITGVGVAHNGKAKAIQGKRVGHTPFVSILAELPKTGSFTLSLLQGWQSRKPCIGNTVTHSKIICQGSF